jgi:hypothetical protein
VLCQRTDRLASVQGPAGVCSVRWSSTAVFMASAPVVASVGLVGGLDVAVIGIP